MNAYLETFWLACCIVSILITSFVVFLHFWIPKLRRHPGQFVMIQCMLQFVYDLHWLSFYPAISKYLTSQPTCKIVGVFANTCFNLGLLYTTALSYELIIKFKNSASMAYYKRSLFYHFFSLTTTFLLETVIFTINGFGVSAYNICGISSPAANTIENVPRAFCTSFLVFSVIYLYKKISSGYSKLMWNYYFIIFAVVITWNLPGIINSFYFGAYQAILIDIGFTLGTLSGTIVGLARLIDVKVFKEIGKKFMSKEKKLRNFYARKGFVSDTDTGYSEDSICEILLKNEKMYRSSESINCFGELFESISKKTQLEIFVTLYVYFTKYAQESEDLERKKDKSAGFLYSNEDFLKLEKFLTDHEAKYLNGSKIIFTEYRPNLFTKIRRSLGHSNEAIANSILSQLEASYTLSKIIHNPANGSLVLFTYDGNYVIKTITTKERQVFFEFLLDTYSKRILEHPESKLIRILGVFKLLKSSIDFILMENTSTVNEDCLIFDLKGSSIDRYVEVEPSKSLEGIVLKDENYKKIGKKVQIDKEQIVNFTRIIKEDMRVLRDIGIMDYSILLTYAPRSLRTNRYFITHDHSLAVIDIFQVYNVKKALERWFKIWIRRVDKNKISVVSPGEYYDRISKFIEEIFTDEEKLELDSYYYL